MAVLPCLMRCPQVDQYLLYSNIVMFNFILELKNKLGHAFICAKCEIKSYVK